MQENIIGKGGKFMGLNLAHGGHLSHGSLVNTSGLIYTAEMESAAVMQLPLSVFRRIKQREMYTLRNLAESRRIIIRPDG